MAKYKNRPKSVLDESMPFGGSSSKIGQLEKPYTDVYTAWKDNPDQTTRGELLRAVDPIIGTALHSYAPTGGPNAKSQAKLLAMKAFDTYDPEKGTLKTHLLSQLRGLQRIQGQSQQIIGIPERVVLDRQQLADTEKEMREELGRDPSDAEIAGRTGLSLKRIGYIRQAKPGTNTGSMVDETGAPFVPPSTVPGEDMPGTVWRELVYHDLGPVDQAIVDYTFGQHGAPVLETREIAKRLGITPGAVSQRKTKIQAMLDEQYGVF